MPVKKNAPNKNRFAVILAGGKGLGFKHGAYKKFTSDVPLNNVYTTMLRRIGVPTQRFGDATGELPELFA